MIGQFIRYICLLGRRYFFFFMEKYTERKKLSNFLTPLLFVYKSLSIKRFRIEQLCLSIDSMISLVFCTLRNFVILNLNVNENHVHYVYSKTDDPLRVKQYTVRELSCHKHTNWKKIFENQCQTSFHVCLG